MIGLSIYSSKRNHLDTLKLWRDSHAGKDHDKKTTKFIFCYEHRQQTWWHVTAERTAKMRDFLMFLVLGKGECKCKTKPFYSFSQPWDSKPDLASTWHCSRVVVWYKRSRSTGWGSGEHLRFCPATSSLTLHTCLRRKLCSCQRQIFSGRKMASLDRSCVKFTVLSLLYSSSDASGAVGYSVIFSLCSRRTLLLHHFSSHFAQSYFFLSSGQASLLSSL